MNPPASRYRSPLRERQRLETRQRILEAAGEVISAEGFDSLSFAAIAKVAGVEARTVFRHFASREALLDAFWIWVHEQAGITGFPRTRGELVALPLQAFPGFDQRENVMRALLNSSHGRAFRLRVNDARQEAVRESLATALEKLPAREQTWLCAAVQLLHSASAWQTMKDDWGLSGEEAGQAASWAISHLLRAIEADGR